ncbi:MAG TPA: chalcone isomerase family protein [Gemmataceae bacterium]|nr:chalcone isomerase family protein [Gemmataceae bacterium]
MFRMHLLALAVLGLGAAAGLAGETVGVDGSSAQYPVRVECNVGGQPVKLVLTGTAVRKKYFFNVYAVASYVQQGAAVHSADELAAADVPKQLHLVMERGVDGKTMAAAFREAVRLNYPAGTFDNELNTLADFMQANPVKKGDQVWLTHIPGVGFRGRLGAKAVLIRNPRFSRAIWDIYLGKNNLGEAIKQGLTSRL